MLRTYIDLRSLETMKKKVMETSTFFLTLVVIHIEFNSNPIKIISKRRASHEKEEYKSKRRRGKDPRIPAKSTLKDKYSWS